MSQRSLNRHFHARVGVSPSAWLAPHRVHASLPPLEQSTLSVDAIAAHVGYRTAASYRKHFRCIMGASPAAHRVSADRGAPSAAFGGDVQGRAADARRTIPRQKRETAAMDIAVVSVVSSAAVAVATLVTTVVSRRADRRHERRLQMNKQAETYELRIADWNMGLTELRREVYVPLLEHALQRLDRHGEAPDGDGGSGLPAPLRARLVAYGSTEARDAWAALEQARDDDEAKAALARLTEAISAETKPLPPGRGLAS